MPAVVWMPVALWVPIGEVPRPPTWVVVVVRGVWDVVPRPLLVAAPPRWPPAGADPGTPCPTGIGAKSSLVIGSLNFLRRNRCSTSTSMFGGYALEYFRWNMP